MSSRANIAKRGATWTYYVYVTGGDGRRRQATKGGFRTRKEAEAARVEALNAVRSGNWVRPERLTVRAFLEDEWLPTQRPPTLEESTYRSYARYVRLHVVPYIGGMALQQITPMDLNAMYRKLLDEGRRRPKPPVREHKPEVVKLVDRLRSRGYTWQAVADAVVEAFPDEGPITRHAVAALHLPAWVFLATTGCRRGECLGLQWGDLDLDAGPGDHLPTGDGHRPRSPDQRAAEDEARTPDPPRRRHHRDAPALASPPG